MCSMGWVDVFNRIDGMGMNDVIFNRVYNFSLTSTMWPMMATTHFNCSFLRLVSLLTYGFSYKFD